MRGGHWPPLGRHDACPPREGLPRFRAGADHHRRERHLAPVEVGVGLLADDGEGVSPSGKRAGHRRDPLALGVTGVGVIGQVAGVDGGSRQRRRSSRGGRGTRRPGDVADAGGQGAAAEHVVRASVDHPDLPERGRLSITDEQTVRLRRRSLMSRRRQAPAAVASRSARPAACPGRRSRPRSRARRAPRVCTPSRSRARGRARRCRW